jgi:hypothetical protein
LRLVSNGAVWPDLVIFSTPTLHFHPRVVRVHEPVRVQALSPKLAVEGLDGDVVGELAGSGEIQDDALSYRPIDQDRGR